MRSDDAVSGLDACAHRCVHPDKVAMVQAAALPSTDLVRAARLFKLLGDPTRAGLMYALLEVGELCVCDLAAATGIQETTVSQALRMLRVADVVVGRRAGRLVYYRLADAHVRMLLDLTLQHLSHDGQQAPGKAGVR